MLDDRAFGLARGGDGALRDGQIARREEREAHEVRDAVLGVDDVIAFLEVEKRVHRAGGAEARVGTFGAESREQFVVGDDVQLGVVRAAEDKPAMDIAACEGDVCRRGFLGQPAQQFARTLLFGVALAAEQHAGVLLVRGLGEFLHRGPRVFVEGCERAHGQIKAHARELRTGGELVHFHLRARARVEHFEHRRRTHDGCCVGDALVIAAGLFDDLHRLGEHGPGASW